MLSFEYQNPTRILFGKDQLNKISQEIPSDAHILLLYGEASAEKNGILAKVRHALAGYRYLEFGGIKPNPDYDDLMKAVDVVNQQRITYLLAVGGGSVIDGAKFISAAACWDLGDPWQIVTNNGKGIRAVIPFGCVLTLPATGSEMNPRAVISRKIRSISLPSGGSQGNSGAVSIQSMSEKEKLEFASPLVFPQFAVLDPELTYSLSSHQVANGIVEAFCHVMEQYLTYPVNANLQDRFAESILQTLITDGPKTLQQPTDFESRANFIWCAAIALNGMIGAGVPQDWSSHVIGHELTALSDLSHAETLAAIFPATMSVRREEKHQKLLQYGKRIWNITKGTEAERVEQAIEQTRKFFASLGVATHLGAYAIKPEQLNDVLQYLRKHNLDKLGEHRSVTLDVAEQILQEAL